jgi:hypothetical protein
MAPGGGAEPAGTGAMVGPGIVEPLVAITNRLV